MTDYTITTGRIPEYPKKTYGGQFVGTRGTLCLEEDFKSLSQNVLNIPNIPITVVTDTPIIVTDKFFGMSIYDRRYDRLSGVTAGTVRILGSKGSIDQWRVIQPTSESDSSKWNWTQLDSWVNTNYSLNKDIVFTLFGTPTWASARPTEEGAFGPGALGCQAEPSDLTKWSAFCTSVAMRYLGKIKYYEVWNEPNYNNDGTGVTTAGQSSKIFFFSGTWTILSQMVRLANQAIKAVDPTAQIICPAVQGWTTSSGLSDSYFMGMLAASDGDSSVMSHWIDIVGVHLYLPTGNKIQDLSGMVDRINSNMDELGISKEIWDTESAPFSPTISGMSDYTAKNLITRTLLTLAGKGIARTIYYQYDQVDMGIATRTDLITHREQIIEVMKSGIVKNVTRFNDGRVAYWDGSKPVII